MNETTLKKFIIVTSDELKMKWMPGGVISGTDKLIYDLKKTRIMGIVWNNRDS